MRVCLKSYNAESLAISFDYNWILIQAIRNLPKGEWIPDERIWVIPDTQENLNKLLLKLYETNLFNYQTTNEEYPLKDNKANNTDSLVEKKLEIQSTELEYKINLCNLNISKYKQILTAKHYSKRTIESYTKWLELFQKRFSKTPENKLTQKEINLFLSELATKRKISASTQNQALAAILFYFRFIEGDDATKFDSVIRAKKVYTYQLCLAEMKFI